ncbi:MAG: electron transfer flavoprotein subunit alpha/FixB family protein [Desulfobacteraceae bacterium]
MAQGVMVIAEQRDGEIRKVSFEVVSEGRRLADSLGQGLTAVVLGSGIKEKAGQLGWYGADKVIAADSGLLAQYTPDAYVPVLADIVKENDPSVVLLGASSFGKDLTARLSAHLGVGMAQDCVSFSVEGDKLSAVRPIYAGKAYAKVSFSEDTPQMATARPNVMPLNEPDQGKQSEVADFTVNLDEGALKVKVADVIKDESGKVDLTEADKIVSGGRGLKGPEGFGILEELAQVIGASVGASRSAVDAGWRPHSDQVGQTGKVVSPNLYIACGISGAIQHLAGMSTSKVIVAVNKDPDAPIFQKADYGVVDDLFKVVPALTEEAKKITA